VRGCQNSVRAQRNQRFAGKTLILAPHKATTDTALMPAITQKPRAKPLVAACAGECADASSVFVCVNATVAAIATPGHTPGHRAFLDTGDRSLFAGDTFTTYVRTEIPNRPLQPFPLAAMGTQDDAEVVESARLLRALDPSVLLVVHGPAVRSPGEAMDAAIRRAGGR
jgi:glyoxylase-like metal-dependent hydrolase (beta-lactamase superfamily II)